MAGFIGDKSGDALMSDINVTPFVDVSLVLLIIFIATSSIIIRAALEVDVPVAANATSKDETAIRSIILRSDGSLALDGKSVTRAGLAAALKADVVASLKLERGRRAKTSVIISASGGHGYQEVVDVIDLVQGAGVGAIALNTKFKEAEALP
jgi:biopolymer transport protein TolR